MQDGIRVMIVDDHEVVRAGLKMLLGQHKELQLVGEAASATEAIRVVDASRPNVVVLDVRLPDGNGVEVCREIRSAHPDIGVLMLTSYSDDQALFQSILAGASGYLLKQVHGQDLIAAIHSVADGGSLLDPAVTTKVLQRIRNPNDDPLRSLTGQERKVLKLVADGKTNRQIAELIFLSEKTVKHYVSSVLEKLEVTRRSAAAAIWAEHEGHGNQGPDA